MIDKIIWSSEWCLDNGIIDEQHKQIVEMLNRISENKININELIRLLIEYSSNHFIDEEVLMIKNNYPEEKYKEHRYEHRAFTKTLLEVSFGLLNTIDKNEFNVIIEKIHHFCFTWFNTHFMNIDRAFVLFLKEGGGVENIGCS